MSSLLEMDTAALCKFIYKFLCDSPGIQESFAKFISQAIGEYLKAEIFDWETLSILAVRPPESREEANAYAALFRNSFKDACGSKLDEQKINELTVKASNLATQLNYMRKACQEPSQMTGFMAKWNRDLAELLDSPDLGEILSILFEETIEEAQKSEEELPSQSQIYEEIEDEEIKEEEDFDERENFIEVMTEFLSCINREEENIDVELKLIVLDSYEFSNVALPCIYNLAIYAVLWRFARDLPGARVQEEDTFTDEHYPGIFGLQSFEYSVNDGEKSFTFGSDEELARKTLEETLEPGENITFWNRAGLRRVKEIVDEKADDQGQGDTSNQ